MILKDELVEALKEMVGRKSVISRLTEKDGSVLADAILVIAIGLEQLEKYHYQLQDEVSGYDP